MLKTLLLIIIISCFVSSGYSQETKFTLKDKVSGFSEKTAFNKKSESNLPPQVKKRKTINTYFGAGYSFMIYTNKYMQDAFPVLDTRSGTFLTNINLFFGFAIAQAVTMEIEPSILFTSNYKYIDYHLTTPHNGNIYGHTTTNSMLAFPFSINIRFFPMFKLKTFARLFFIGGGAGAIWLNEENDVYYNNDPGGGYNILYPTTISSSQWAPMFRIITGFTGSGGAMGFGGEVRYNIIPLKQETSVPFATRFASNANSVDLTLRFYFSL
jgi:hypothetical protein